MIVLPNIIIEKKILDSSSSSLEFGNIAAAVVSQFLQQNKTFFVKNFKLKQD
jgi:hypothetical protein